MTSQRPPHDAPAVHGDARRAGPSREPVAGVSAEQLADVSEEQAAGLVAGRPADTETLISQALRAQVGGPRRAETEMAASGVTAGDPPTRHVTRAQILLLTALIGLIVGMAAGFAVLMVWIGR